ncbi:biotin-dependent carboxyltransferase family protein [Pseudidiomarina sp.]|uniref:5-oxoprolinase subunit C family protein n=1 Tax=Pseudidiomarina sp. TaxID=2081707 RepID=UPI00299E041E|nr:biotin-dependent carboxyltransferase family protein [Pseudidiomarina sp.]MDX1705691.1 biotin-dependent carboxyltransferase family protein [Pseudidiomarina sp.]
MKPLLEVEQPGLLASLQDFGRYGYLAQGITTGGPVDEHAFLWANRLLSNHYNAAQIEITLGGFKARLKQTTQWVTTGAQVEVLVNGKVQPNWQVFTGNIGDQLQINPPQHGLRAYLAVAGGFAAPLTMGSVATVQRDGLGGLRGDGAPLRAGDLLSGPAVPASNQALPRRPQSRFVSDPGVASLQLEVIPVAQAEQFTAAARDAFSTQQFEMTTAQDRMGARLKASAPVRWQGPQLISEPLPVGAIQIPPDGQPIIMLNDRQTLGGYPKIGQLSWRSRAMLAQATAGTKLQFRWIDLTEAQRQQRSAYCFFNVLTSR